MEETVSIGTTRSNYKNIIHNELGKFTEHDLGL